MISKKKQNLQKHYIISLVIVLLTIFFISLINASNLGDGYWRNKVIKSNGLNLTINITTPLYFAVIIESNSIYFENLRINNLDLCRFSTNLTEKNKYYESNYLIGLVNNYCVPIGQGGGGGGGTTIVSNATGEINVSLKLNIYVDYYYKGINVYSFPEILKDKFDGIKIKLELENNYSNLTNIQIDEIFPTEIRNYFGDEIYSVKLNETKMLWESSIIKTSDLNDSLNLTVKLLGLNNKQETIFINNYKSINITKYVEENTTTKATEEFSIGKFITDNLFIILILIIVAIIVFVIIYERR